MPAGTAFSIPYILQEFVYFPVVHTLFLRGILANLSKLGNVVGNRSRKGLQFVFNTIPNFVDRIPHTCKTPVENSICLLLLAKSHSSQMNFIKRIIPASVLENSIEPTPHGRSVRQRIASNKWEVPVLGSILTEGGVDCLDLLNNAAISSQVKSRVFYSIPEWSENTIPELSFGLIETICGLVNKTLQSSRQELYFTNTFLQYCTLSSFLCTQSFCCLRCFLLAALRRIALPITFCLFIAFATQPFLLCLSNFLAILRTSPDNDSPYQNTSTH